MNAETLKLITQTSLAVLVLGVLVWALHSWNLERERQAEIQNDQRMLLVDTIIKGIENGREERRELMSQISNLTSQQLARDRVDERIIDLLQSSLDEVQKVRVDMASHFDAVTDGVKRQTRSIQRGLDLPRTQ